MSSSDNPSHAPSNRRDFLQNVMSAGAVIASAGSLTSCATTNTKPGAQGRPESPLWDMSWQTKLGRYKTVYDAPEPLIGSPLATVALTIAGYKAALSDSAKEFTPVIVLRHNASVMTLNDEMWNRLKAGESNKLKDPETGELAVRNPFLRHVAGASEPLVSADSSITALMQNGAIIIACNRALNVLSFQLRRREPNTFATNELALAEIRRHVIPGVFVMPNGLFAVAAAQDAGCGYVRVLPQ